jgi:predicted nucleic acid-binding protein
MSTSPTEQYHAIVLDINVLIYAFLPNSPGNAAAERLLTTNLGKPSYVSDTMLRTLTGKLLEKGADPQGLQDYCEVLMTDTGYGPAIHVIEHVVELDHSVKDRNGRHDFEDATVLSLVDYAENDVNGTVLLVSDDQGIRDAYFARHRPAVTSAATTRLMPGRPAPGTHDQHLYAVGRVFPRREPASWRTQAQTHALARSLVTQARDNAHEIIAEAQVQPHRRPAVDYIAIEPQPSVDGPGL